MDELRLGRLFRNLVSTSLLAALASPACSSSESDEKGAPLDDGGAGTGGDGGTGDSGTGAGGAGTGGAGGAGTGGTGGAGTGGTGDAGTGGTGGAGTGGTGGTGGADGGLVPQPLWPDLEGKLTLPPCNDAGQRTAPLEVAPASAVDYLGLYEADGFGTPDAGAPRGRMLDESGTPCSGAADEPACLAALAAATTDLVMTESCGGPPYACQHYILTTSGDTVRLWLPAEYATLFGSIDTPDEARLLTHEGTFGGRWVPACGSVAVSTAGYDVVGTRMVQDCAPIVNMREHVHVAPDGTVTLVRTNVASVSGACVGRRSEGLASAPARCPGALGDFFTQVAHLEAASVDAFRHLADELRALGAPEALRERALRSAGDEVRHADVMSRLARRFGGRPTEPEVHPLPLRDLERLATENMVEGCVRETFGALFATYQAQAASDREIARALAAVAEDETRHAALAWEIADWADALLSDAARARVSAARERAVAELRAELGAPVPAELQDMAGVPDARASQELLGGLERALLS